MQKAAMSLECIALPTAVFDVARSMLLSPSALVRDAQRVLEARLPATRARKAATIDNDDNNDDDDMPRSLLSSTSSSVINSTTRAKRRRGGGASSETMPDDALAPVMPASKVRKLGGTTTITTSMTTSSAVIDVANRPQRRRRQRVTNDDNEQESSLKRIDVAQRIAMLQSSLVEPLLTQLCALWPFTRVHIRVGSTVQTYQTLFKVAVIVKALDHCTMMHTDVAKEIVQSLQVRCCFSSLFCC
jgi:hypothetical protein